MKVTLPYDPLWTPLEWAKEYCPSYITNTAIEDGKICYYFSDDAEATMFKLKWA